MTKNKRGIIYYIRDPISGLVKIGWTSNLNRRLHQIQTGCPGKLKILHARRGTMDEEKREHALWADYRVRGEWFRLEIRNKLIMPAPYRAPHPIALAQAVASTLP